MAASRELLPVGGAMCGDVWGQLREYGSRVDVKYPLSSQAIKREPLDIYLWQYCHERP